MVDVGLGVVGAVAVVGMAGTVGVAGIVGAAGFAGGAHDASSAINTRQVIVDQMRPRFIPITSNLFSMRQSPLVLEHRMKSSQQFVRMSGQF